MSDFAPIPNDVNFPEPKAINRLTCSMMVSHQLLNDTPTALESVWDMNLSVEEQTWQRRLKIEPDQTVKMDTGWLDDKQVSYVAAEALLSQRQRNPSEEEKQHEEKARIAVYYDVDPPIPAVLLGELGLGRSFVFPFHKPSRLAFHNKAQAPVYIRVTAFPA